MRYAVAFLIALLLSLNGCILGPLAARQLTAEQIAALKEYNGDVYACLAVNAPPPGGGGIFLLVPKGVRPNIQFSPSCQIVIGEIK